MSVNAISLQVIDKAIANLRAQGCTKAADDLEEFRRDVALLIEADRAFAAAKKQSRRGDLIDVVDLLRSSNDKRRAALDRIVS